MHLLHSQRTRPEHKKQNTSVILNAYAMTRHDNVYVTTVHTDRRFLISLLALEPLPNQIFKICIFKRYKVGDLSCNHMHNVWEFPFKGIVHTAGNSEHCCTYPGKFAVCPVLFVLSQKEGENLCNGYSNEEHALIIEHYFRTISFKQV